MVQSRNQIQGPNITWRWVLKTLAPKGSGAHFIDVPNNKSILLYIW